MSALLKNAQLPLLLALWLATGAISPWIMPARCYAQLNRKAIPPDDQKDPEQGFNGVFLPSDRTLSRGIQRARERISAGEFSRAIRFLDEVLDPRKEDSFVAVGDLGEYAGLKETARQILRELPAEGRQAYEITYGPVARRELRAAIQGGDFDHLRRVAQRYFYTSAGYEAALLLAGYEADKGWHFSAALAYQQLIDTPEAAKRYQPQLSVLAALNWLAIDDQPRARKLLEDLSNQQYRSVRIGGEETRLDSIGPKPLNWLRQTVGSPKIKTIAPENQWLTYRGNAARNGQVDGGLPHMRVRWQVRLLAHHKMEALHDDLVADLIRKKKAIAVSAAPLAVGNYVITRSAHNLIAVDFQTGKLVWQAEPQRVPEFESLVNANATNHEEEARGGPTRSFANRIWEDYLYNSVSSDGERAYVIRDLSSPAVNDYNVWAMPFVNGRRSTEGPVGTNRLCAFDLATQGKLVWEIDGASDKEDFAGAFFLGTPLAVGQSLYCLVEIKSAIYLTAMDRLSGQLQWRQQLANLETGILLDPRRRLQASTPSYDAGILVCPTGAGVVIGVDLTKKSLAWAYRYETNRSPLPSLRVRNSRQLQPTSHWMDVSAILSGGRILLTPPESDSLHCLDLVTGKRLWKRPRNEHLFVAGIHQDRVLLVGNQHLTALRMEDGTPAWSVISMALPEGSVPTGRGFFSKGRYFLPLSTAEVVAVDMELGSIVDRTVARDGQVLGNLVCHRGAVLSQNGQFLDRFDQIKVLRDESQEQLARDPTDFEALRTLGEIAYNEGQLSKAIDLLQQAHQSSAEDLRTREVLAESLIIALDENFASYRNRLPLLRKLQAASGNGGLTLLRLEAHGLLEIGDPVGAFKACLQLYAEETGANDWLHIGRHHQVEVSRWLRAQVSAIWEQASASEREQITSLTEKLLDQLPENPGGGEYQRLVDCLGTLDRLDPLAMRLARQDAADGRHLEAQQRFMHLANSTDEKIRAESVAACSQILHALDLARLAQPFDKLLNSTLADVPCFEGKTGQQCLEAWGADSVVKRPAWPYGQVDVSKTLPPSARDARHTMTPQWGIRLERSDAVLGRGNLMLSTTRGEVIAHDSYGKEFFRAVLADRRHLPTHDPSQVYGVARGNLLIVSMGRQLVAFDTLGTGASGPTEALWRVDVTSSLDTRYLHSRINRGRQNNRPGTFRASRSQSDGKWVGVIGPLTHDSCIFQDQRRLICVDSRTGEQRWTRTDVPPGCDLYGDDNYVLAVPYGSRNAMIFSTLDGRSLGETTVPRWREQLATLGRHVIRWRKRADGRLELSSFDSISGETAWEQAFERNARVDIAMGRYVAVVDHTGVCVVIDATNGKRLVDQTLPLKPQVTNIHLLAGSDRFVLAAQVPSTKKSTRHANVLNRVDYAMIDGLVYVFDRHTGQPTWKRPAEVRQQSLMLSQPVDAPVLAFVGNMPRRDSRGSRQGISMLVLEKTSGRLLFSDDSFPASRGNYCAVKVLGPDAYEVFIETSSQSVRLAFTEQPRPPEPPAMTEMESKNENGKKGLLGIGQKIIGGG